MPIINPTDKPIRTSSTRCDAIAGRRFQANATLSIAEVLSTVEYANPNTLISTAELAGLLAKPGVRILDSSFKMPGVTPTAAEDYRARHIPGALFFDIDTIADRASSLPHMLPSPREFEAAAGALGISNATRVIVYDAPGPLSAPRAWWTFRVFGHDQVAVLDGGLKKWIAEGRPLSREVETPQAQAFRARFRPELVRAIDAMRANLASRAEQVIDARSKGRFEGTEPESWPGRRSGHIPGSLNLSSDQLLDPSSGAYLQADELRRRFAAAGIDFARPVAASCGSGVTACALAFGLHLLGHQRLSVYDGSWAEWGLPGDTPVELGAARH
jgi:thiosulfate/3-mercaptopyruvate sulfurtransferase